MAQTERPEQTVPPGLRERKKEKTRRRVAEVAARLFIKHGYENVRMIDIARATDISEQTLYNYFPTKEHLILDRDREFEEVILRAVLDRPRGQSLPKALRANALLFLEQISPAIGKPSWVPASVAMGPELRRVWLEINARCADSLTEALLKSAVEAVPRPAAKLMARSIVAFFATLVEGVSEGSFEGKSRDLIIEEMLDAIEISTHLIRRGFPSRSLRTRTPT
jgi:AcrR family transcriptional regulator